MNVNSRNTVRKLVSSGEMSNPVAHKNDKKIVHAKWTFLSNHGHVLLCLAEDQDVVLREVATRVGITERAVQNIVRDLEAIGAIRIEREGRRNHYVVNRDLNMRHPIESHRQVGDLLDFVLGRQ